MSPEHTLILVLVALFIMFLLVNRDIGHLRERVGKLEEQQQTPSRSHGVLHVVKWVVQIIVGVAAAAELLSLLR